MNCLDFLVKKGPEKNRHSQLQICSLYMFGNKPPQMVPRNQQEFQVPKMEGFLNLINLYKGGVRVFLTESRIHTA